MTIYAELANTLFANLFGSKLVDDEESPSDILGQFLHEWRTLEANLTLLQREVGLSERPGGVLQSLRFFAEKNILLRPDIEELQSLARVRNQVVHAQPGSNELLNPDVIARIVRQAEKLAKLAKKNS